MINARTSLFCVLGDPVEHSMSPVMHNAAFAQVGFNGVYVAFRVKGDDIKGAVQGIRTLGICGASVTIPHKVSVMEHLDVIDPLAEKIGAVNTIVNQNGTLTGYNSDCIGAMQAISEKTSISQKRVAIIGAGGAARGAGFGVIEEGGTPVIVNRSEKKGRALANDLCGEFLPLDELGGAQFDIIINATPLGMSPNVDSSPVDSGIISKDTVIMDMVYNPLETKFIRDASKAGCTTITGLNMFIFQAAFQFGKWTNKKPPIDLMKKVVITALKV